MISKFHSNPCLSTTHFCFMNHIILNLVPLLRILNCDQNGPCFNFQQPLPLQISHETYKKPQLPFSSALILERVTIYCYIKKHRLDFHPKIPELISGLITHLHLLLPKAIQFLMGHFQSEMRIMTSLYNANVGFLSRLEQKILQLVHIQISSTTHFNMVKSYNKQLSYCHSINAIMQHFKKEQFNNQRWKACMVFAVNSLQFFPDNIILKQKLAQTSTICAIFIVYSFYNHL